MAFHQEPYEQCPSRSAPRAPAAASPFAPSGPPPLPPVCWPPAAAMTTTTTTVPGLRKPAFRRLRRRRSRPRRSPIRRSPNGRSCPTPAPCMARPTRRPPSRAGCQLDGRRRRRSERAARLPAPGRRGGPGVDFSVEGPALLKELDVEASTVIGNLAFFLGSHGNSKDGGDAVAERGHMFAVEISGTGSDTRFSYVGIFSQLEQQLVAWDSGNLHGQGVDYFGFARLTAAGLGAGTRRRLRHRRRRHGSSTAKRCGWAFRAPQWTATSATARSSSRCSTRFELVTGRPARPAFARPSNSTWAGRGIRSMGPRRRRAVPDPGRPGGRRQPPGRAQLRAVCLERHRRRRAA